MKTIISFLSLLLFQSFAFSQPKYMYEYDESGNRSRRYANTGCCECPPNKDSWLTLISERDTDDTECGLTTCKITHILDIPAEYDCYTHYVVGCKVGDRSTTTYIAPLPTNKQLPLIDRCLQNGEILDVRLELYTSIYDTEPCVIEKSYECPVYCECPPNHDDWLTLTAEPGTQAYPDKCELTHSLNIPAEYNCFDWINVTYVLSGATASSGSTGWVLYQGDSDLNNINPNFNFPVSLDKDVTMHVTIRFARYYNPSTGAIDPNCCDFTKTISCSYDCCDYYDLTFVPVEEGACEFFVYVSTTKDQICPLESIDEIVVLDADTGEQFELNEDGESYRLTLNESTQRLKYIFIANGKECEAKEIDLSCGSACTPCPREGEINRWFDYYVDKYSDKCEPGQCFIGQHLNIPTAYSSCYTGYTISYILRGNGETEEFSNHSKDPKSIPPNGILPELPSCVDAGKIMIVNIKLYGHDGAICDIFSDIEFCQLATNPERGDACTSNNPEFGGTVVIEGCEYKFLYRFGFSTDGYQDIEITYVETDDDECNIDEAYLMQEVLKAAIEDAIKNHDKAKPALDNDGCSDQWRVFQNTCWSKWMANRPGPDGYEIQTIEVPCGSACCSRHLQVCIIKGKLSVKDLGVAPGSATSDCSQAKAYRPSDVIQIDPVEHCNDKTCEIYAWIGETEGRDVHYNKDYFIDLEVYNTHFLGDVVVQGKIGSNDNISHNNYVYQLTHYQDMIEMIIAESSLNNMVIQIFNLLGQEQSLFNFELNGGMQTLQIPIDKLTSGTYIMTISNNGNLYESIKINIVK